MMRIRLLTLYLICLTCNLLTAQTVQWSVKPTYSSLEEYVGKLYKYRENGKVGLVDISGKVLVEAKYDSITPFIDYHALALNRQGGNYMLRGIINQYDLKLIEMPQGYFPSKDYPYFSEGKLVVYDTSRKYGYLQTDGSFFIECAFHEAFPFYHGRALVYKDRTTAEYLKDDGTFLTTQLEEENYCTLLPNYCSAFNEEGLAFIGGKSAYHGLKEMIVDINGKKAKGVNKNKYKERESFFTETSDALEVAIASHILPVEEHGLFGFQFEGCDTLCVPAQFIEAFPFKEGYAKVKQDDKYGILKWIPNVSFDGKFLQQTMEVLNGKVDSLTYILKLPQQFVGMDWKLIMEDDLGLDQPYLLKNSLNGNCVLSFKPDLRNKKKEKKYRFSLYVDGLLLWRDNETVAFSYLYRSDVSVIAPQVAEGYRSDDDGYLWAKDDMLSVYSLIKNQSKEVLEFEVTMGAKDRNTQKILCSKKEKIKLASNSEYEFGLEIENIDKKYELDVYIQIPSNGIKQNKIIKVKPIY